MFYRIIPVLTVAIDTNGQTKILVEKVYKYSLSSFFSNIWPILQNTLEFVVNKAKGRISKPVCQENKAGRIFRKTNISYMCVSGKKKCSFFGKFGVLCFLVTPVLKFALLPYYQRIQMNSLEIQVREFLKTCLFLYLLET